MEIEQNPTSSAWWIRLFSQMNQLNDAQINPQKENLSRFQQMLLQLQTDTASDENGANDLNALAFKNSALETQGEDNAVMSLSLMDPEKLLQAIQQSLGEAATVSDLSSERLDQKLALLKQDMGELSAQSRSLSSSLTHSNLSASMGAGSLSQHALASQAKITTNQDAVALTSHPASTDEFFYHFAAAPGVTQSALSRTKISFRTTDTLKGLNSGENLNNREILSSDTPLSKTVFSNGIDSSPAITKQNTGQQKLASEENHSDYKSTAQATRSMLVESSTDAAGNEGADIRADTSKESGVETAMKLKLQDPNLRAQLNGKLADRIQLMINQGVQQARIQLDPPELGMLEVRIQFQQDQVQVNILSQSSQVREALEGHSVRLRDLLEQQGIQLAGFDVQDQSQQGASDFSNQGGRGQSHSEQGSIAQQQNADIISQDAQKATTNVVSATLSLDVFV